MANRRETPFPKRKTVDVVKAPATKPIRGALHFDDDLDSDLSTLIEDEVIMLLSSSSSSGGGDGVINLLDSNASSNSSSTSNKTFCVTPSPSKLTTPLNRTLMARTTGTPAVGTVSCLQQRRGSVVISGSSSQKPVAKPTAKGAEVPEVLRLYQTQAMAELSRLEANVAKWKLSARQDQAYRLVIDEAQQLLAGPGAEFQLAVDEAIRMAGNKDAELLIASRYKELQTKVSQVYKNFAFIPPEVLRTPMRSKLPAKLVRSAERPTSALIGPFSTPKTCPGLSMCSRIATPSKLIVNRTPNSARSKIPVFASSLRRQS